MLNPDHFEARFYARRGGPLAITIGTHKWTYAAFCRGWINLPIWNLGQNAICALKAGFEFEVRDHAWRPVKVHFKRLGPRHA